MRFLLKFCCIAGILSGLNAALLSQTAPDTEPIATLHVSTTLMEIPLLIRDHSGELPIPSLPPGSIEVRLGDGVWLRPNYVRQEGQDPIELALMLDLNSPVSDLQRPLTQALSSLKSLSLSPKDHVSLFTMDCASVRITNIPADPAKVIDAVKSAIEPSGQSGKQTCKEGGRLWDTLAAVSRVLQSAPSRRVLVAITNGKDHGSVVPPQSLAELAEGSAVAIFDLDPTENSANNFLALRGLPLIAQSTGGLALGVDSGSLRQQIQRVVSLLRGRYIVQLRVPSDAKAGRLSLSARVTEHTAETFTVRITGNSAPLPNPAEAGSVPSQIAKADASPKADPGHAVDVADSSTQTVTPVTPSAAASDESQPAQQAAVSTAEEVSIQAAQRSPANAGAAPRTAPSLPEASVPTLKVDTRLTLVDVTVTDSKGRPVRGLTQADFVVKEDGKPQAIKNFEELGKNEKITEASAPALPPDVYSNQHASRAAAQAVNILLFDQVSTGISRGLQPSREALQYAKEAATEYLKTMPAETQVAVMTMDEKGLHTQQGFTSDTSELLTALKSIAYQEVPDAHWSPDPGGPPPCPAANFQSQQALNALNQTALFVSDIPGRKNLIWFTPGIPWLTDYPPFSQVRRCVVINYTSQLQQVYGRLTAARVALYPIDARGLYNDPTGEAAQGGRPVNNPLGFINQVDEDRRMLDDVANATGGKAHFGGNDLVGALRDDTATGADYYALSYMPPLSKYDGKYHTIEVKVNHPGVQLGYRRGYTSIDVNGPLLETDKAHGNPSPPKNAFQTAMSYGVVPTTQLMFDVKALPSAAQPAPGDTAVIGSLNPELKGKPLVRYSFDFDLPRDKITLEAQPDGSRKASFELAIAAYDVQGRVLNSLDEKRSFVLKPEMVEGFLQKPFVVPVEIDLPAGNASVRAGVVDLPSEEIGVAEIPLSVAK